MFEREFDDAPDFEEIPDLNFFQDACASMARNACILLKAAGEPVTSHNVLRIIHSLPPTLDHTESEVWRVSYIVRLLHRCAARGSPLHEDLHWYFVTVNVRLPFIAHRMREAAFSGILGGIDWEAAMLQPPEERHPLPVVDDQRRPLGPMAGPGRGVIGKLAGWKTWLTRKKDCRKL
jgi:hypothetical protein